MDTITQGLLGATWGVAVCGRSLGIRRAAAWGAVGGLAPDIDILAFPGTLDEFRYHRGITHSLWFGPVVGTAVGLASARLARRRGADGAGTTRDWITLWVLALLTHPLLDVFTTYGTMLLAPFSDLRFAFDSVAIVDPVYSLALVAALVLSWRRPARHLVACAAALVFTNLYLVLGLWANERAVAEARRQLTASGVAVTSVHAYPTILQMALWRVVARDADHVRVGFVSLAAPGPIVWQASEVVRDPRIDALRATPEGRLYEWFAMDQTLAVLQAEDSGARVVVEDLRFGWSNRPEDGLWALEGRFGPDGALTGRPQRINRRVANPTPLLATILRSAFVSPDLAARQ